MNRIIDRKGFQKAIVGMMALLMVFSVSTRVSAASDTATARIAVQQKISGTESSDETFTYRLEAEDASSPLPENQETTVDGAGQAAFDITFTQVGVYRYTLSQIPGSAEGWTYDDEVYTADVYVLRDASLENLETHVIYYNSQGEKVDPAWTNTYEAPVQDPGNTESTAASTAAVQTGDTVNIQMWTVLIGAAAVVMIIIGKAEKKARA